MKVDCDAFVSRGALVRTARAPCCCAVHSLPICITSSYTQQGTIRTPSFSVTASHAKQNMRTGRVRKRTRSAKLRGFCRSNDDYYVMNSGLVVMDTSLPQLTLNPYDDVKSGPVPLPRRLRWRAQFVQSTRRASHPPQKSRIFFCHPSTSISFKNCKVYEFFSKCSYTL